VWIVAGHAALADRRVLPQIRSTLVRVTRGAALVNRGARLEQLDVRAAMDVVARRAGQCPLSDRHMVEPMRLVSDVAVARGALVRHALGFELRRPLGSVDAVAGRTADVPLIVLTAVPQRMRRTVVARRAGAAHLGWRRALEVSDQRWITAFGMLLTGTVTAFAALRGGRRTRLERIGVSRPFVGLVRMTREARRLADVTHLRRRALRHGESHLMARRDD